MSNQTIRPGLTAAMRVGRELHAAGWRYDLRTAMADDTTIRDLLHPSGREIHARTSSDGELTELTMTGLTLEQAADAITAAGLTATAEAAQGGQGETTSPQTIQHKLAAELIRLARHIVRLDLPLKDTMCGSLSLGVLASRADLERWADYLGTEIKVNSTNSIPSVSRRILLDERTAGAWLDVRAQINPEGPSEVERLRAEVAELRAQVAGGKSNPVCSRCGGTSGLAMLPRGPLDPVEWACADGLCPVLLAGK